MPCGDITERIKLSIDNDDRLVSYRFSKKTCGGGIGTESLLDDWVIGQHIDEIIGQNQFAFAATNFSRDDIEEFLKLKHFNAIQTVIRVFLGLSPGGVGSPCTIAGIEYDRENIVIDAEISIDLNAEKVKACEHCGPG